MQDLNSQSLEEVAFQLYLAKALMAKDGGKYVEKGVESLKNNEKPVNLAEIEAKVQEKVKQIDDVLASQKAKTGQENSQPVGIYIDGVFDLMHVGHYNAIRQAKTLGDFLVTAVVADAIIMKVKGPTVLNAIERTEILKHCKFVDKIVQQEGYAVTLEVMDENSCQYFAHGDDPCFHEDGSDALKTFKDSNRLKIFKRTEGISTTEMTRRILALGEYQRLLEESPEKAEQFLQARFKQAPKQKFLATSKRILNFSNGIPPKENDKVIYVQGSFDLLHYGHLKRLEEAKKKGTFVYVGLWDDELTRYYKGSLYPLVSLQERVLMTLACKHVDDVIIGAPYVITEDLLKSLNVQKVVRFVNSSEDTVLQEHKDIDQFEVPKKLNILEDISIEDEFFNLTTEKLALRVFENRSHFEQKFSKKNATEQKYYEQSKEFIIEA